MFGAGCVTAGRIDFSLRVHKTAKKVRVLVVNRFDMILTKITLFHKTGDR